MKAAELEAKFKASENKLTASALIEYKDQRGIVIRLGENLCTGTWLSGDLICFWDDGENTVLPDDFELITFDLFGFNLSKLLDEYLSEVYGHTTHETRRSVVNEFVEWVANKDHA